MNNEKNNLEIKKLEMKTKHYDKILEKVADICPSAIQNGKIDFERLKAELVDVIDNNTYETYDFRWVGKNESILEANKPINKTLRPCKEESKNWDTTQNLYIEGDNLEVLKLLEETYVKKIKMIYIDPPYNTGNDFVYHDNRTQSEEDLNQGIFLFDEEDNRLLTKSFVRNTESNGRFHSDWCSMMYPRLKLARDLLADDGVIFISIDDNEVANLKKICDEVFGEENFVGNFVRRTINSGKQDSTTLSVYHEYLLLYAKNINNVKLNRRIKNSSECKKLYPLEDQYLESRGRYYISQLDKGSIQYSDSLNYPIKAPDGSEIWPGNGINDKTRVFRWSKEKVEWGIKNDYIVFKQQKNKWKVYAKSYEFRDNSDNEIIPSNPYTTLDYVSKDYSNFNATPELQKLFNGKNLFNFPKPVIFMKDLVSYSTTDNDIILDFFSGSATTAHAVMELNAEDGGNRKFIMVQLQEEIDQKNNKDAYDFCVENNFEPLITSIGKERIRRAGEKIVQETGKKDLDIGFRVLKVDESNMQDVYYRPIETKQDNLFDRIENIKPDRTALDLLFGVMVEWGVELSLSLKEIKNNANTIYVVGDSDLVACFDKEVDDDTITKMAELMPTRVIFRDSCFDVDDKKINMFEIFKTICNWDDKQAMDNVRVI